jgi:hypothetical protein
MTRKEVWVTFVSQMLSKANWKDSFDIKSIIETADKMTKECDNRFSDDDY